jgi:hypothetical protein
MSSPCIKAQAAPKGRIDGSSEVMELKVLGDWAFMWTKLRVVVPHPMAPPVGWEVTRLFLKEHGKWLLARDANLLSPVQRPRT